MNPNQFVLAVICICLSLFSFAQNPDFKYVEVTVLKRVEAFSRYNYKSNMTNSLSEFKVSIKNNGNTPVVINLDEVFGVDRAGNTYSLRLTTLSKKKKTIKPKKSLKQTLLFEPTTRHKPIYLVIEGRQYSLY